MVLMTSSLMTSLIPLYKSISITSGGNGIKVRRFRAQTELKADVGIKDDCKWYAMHHTAHARCAQANQISISRKLLELGSWNFVCSYINGPIGSWRGTGGLCHACAHEPMVLWRHRLVDDVTNYFLKSLRALHSIANCVVISIPNRT